MYRNWLKTFCSENQAKISRAAQSFIVGVRYPSEFMSKLSFANQLHETAEF